MTSDPRYCVIGELGGDGDDVEIVSYGGGSLVSVLRASPPGLATIQSTQSDVVTACSLETKIGIRSLF
jgi:hypothetical protein